MKLYGFGFRDTIVTIGVGKETPKGYKIKPGSLLPHQSGLHVPKFVKKYDGRWFPAQIGLTQWMREVLKKRIVYALENIVRATLHVGDAEDRHSKAVQALRDYDLDKGIVDSDDECEESFWMEQQKAITEKASL